VSTPHLAGSTHCPGFVTDLVVRCGRGDETALARLFALFYAPVSAAVRKRATGRAAEELTAKVFVRLWRHAPTYQPGDQSPVDWVMSHVPHIMSSLSPDADMLPRSLASELPPTAGVPNDGPPDVSSDRARQSQDPKNAWPLSAATPRPGTPISSPAKPKQPV
jgi:hypothetical protein